ncbi:MAG: hypothetical protein LBK96_02805 [Prevotellaceae bacterium]|jgi:hypothetical protein|nr:hypothetical protein [Prevotellaceae bacterium]
MKFFIKMFVVLFGFAFTEDRNINVAVFEKVYLHLDRHFYFAGDDIWFKAYLVDAQTNRPSPTSRIVYAELISPKSKILNRLILAVDSLGSAAGDFMLKNTAVSGKYRVRAYTQWMLNFGDNFVFEKEIEVINPDASQGKKPETDANDDKQQEIAVKNEDVEIEFFPESGSLIAGVENHFGAYYWNPNIRTGNNGEVLVSYNPKQQASGKNRIEGLTDDGIPFTVKN